MIRSPRYKSNPGRRQLAKWREDSGISQTDLGNELKTSPSQVSRWEEGWTRPDIANGALIQHITGIGALQWLTNEERKRFKQILEAPAAELILEAEVEQ